MSLDIRSLVRTGVDLAFDLTGQAQGAGYVQKSGTYRRRAGATYDPETGAVVPSETDVAITFIVAPYTERELVQDVPDRVQQPVQMGDERVVVDLATLANAGVTDMDTDDQVLETLGPVRQVLEVFRDPTEQVAVLHTRRPGL